MVLLATTVRNTMVDAATALANGGSLQIGTTGFATVLATFTLQNPAYGAAASGEANGAGLPIATTAAATGTPAAYRVRDSLGNTIWSGTSLSVTGGGGEVTLSSLSLTNGQSISLTSLFYRQPAGS